ncbi:MAG TPA: AsmA-like C-terminal region-containing protein [Bacteroidales bacterium]|nr:MAG: hypothetical protein BWX96_00320 [Bacteroidetes bacterium ADurb.Bin145]HOU03044.1 AsmA-like C-terminal region-containing protein [Bacteroidales bacterium]HQG63876.1 AsmA-like C-terminal region-containing protein [Bacteroidales bacterium]HQK66785.1 AsmA-like C-terminal region-containing protein [Bacteroidales bacterium]
MKKISGIILKSVLGLILVLLIVLFTVPVLFKNKIKTKVEQVINESVNAKVSFDDYKLGFFRNFPDLSFSLEGLSVAGIGVFENDTLAKLNSLDLVFNLSSLFGKSGYEVKSVIIKDAKIKTIVLKDGSANYDIVKETEEAETTEATSSSPMKILLKKVEIVNSSLSYVDLSADMEASINDLNFNMKGDLTASTTDLEMSLNSADVNFIMEGIRYLNKAVADAKMNLDANLDSMIFRLRDNYLTLNDLKLNFEGMVAMPGDDIETDLIFKTDQTSFKTLLSLIPAIYMTDFQDLNASGNFTLEGSAIGVYSDADSTLPDVSLKMAVNNGLISYPALPEKITNINLKTDLFVDGKDLDKTTVDVSNFHMELAGNPFDMTFYLRNPMSDPDFRGSMLGKLDLTALSKAIPLDSMVLGGVIDMSVKMAGRLSMIEKEQYDKFQASGNLGITRMKVVMAGYPSVDIKEAGFEFTPAYAALTKAELTVGEKSDFNISGRLENYIPYLFSDATIKGNLALRSNTIDVSNLLAGIAADTTEVEDTTSLAVVKIPQNIDFDFNALINNLIYGKIRAKDVKGHILVRDGVLTLRETGMNILGGSIAMNADYDTRDSLKPFVKADLSLQSFGVKEAFNTFNTIQKLAPAAAGVDGRVNAKLSFQSLLGSDMMPVIQTIAGGGKLQSNEITVVTSAAFDQMKNLLKLGDSFTNVFKDLNVSFNLKDGRVYVSPFDTKVGNIKMNISGDQGLDQTMNYIIKTEVPRSELGSSVNTLVNSLSAQAAAFGIGFKPADVMKINVKISGVFGKPVVTPLFGSATGESSTGAVAPVKEVAKQAVDNAIDTGKDKLRQEAEAKGDELIREAEQQGNRLREEAAKGAETIRKEADARAQKLIDDASSKGTVAKLAAQKAADTMRKEADKRASQLEQEADAKANKLLEEAKAKKEDLLNKI